MVPCNPTDPGANGRTCRCIGKILTCYAMRETEEQMHRIFPYISSKGGEHGLYRPQIVFDNADSFAIGSIRVERVEHGFPCCGYLIGEDLRRKTEDLNAVRTEDERRKIWRLAYISDCHVLPEETIEKTKGVDTLVLNCLREREHPTHLKLSAALEYIERIGAPT